MRLVPTLLSAQARTAFQRAALQKICVFRVSLSRSVRLEDGKAAAQLNSVKSGTPSLSTPAISAPSARWSVSLFRVHSSARCTLRCRPHSSYLGTFSHYVVICPFVAECDSYPVVSSFTRRNNLVKEWTTGSLISRNDAGLRRNRNRWCVSVEKMRQISQPMRAECSAQRDYDIYAGR